MGLSVVQLTGDRKPTYLWADILTCTALLTRNIHETSDGVSPLKEDTPQHIP